ncbi:MAG: hypothetical protein JO301_12705 [Chitinophagaceae bacterium]|nr:hypothetical protein [Chitinophagaceae bacterium]
MPRLRYIFLILVSLLLLTLGCYLLIFNWLVPRTAGYAIPMRWHRIPLRESKTIVQGYFGEPASITPDSETWIANTRAKQYQLHIYYINDSIASAYSIYYRYSSRLVTRNYLLDSASIR